MRRLRRADRLFHIIQLLRRKRVVTAAQLAAELEVSERTVYRDLRDLMARGTPIEGEPGVGYRLRREYDLPPLMFEAEELEALALGARIVERAGDERLAKASKAVLAKVEAVLPAKRRGVIAKTPLFVPMRMHEETTEMLSMLRHAIAARVKVRMAYQRADGEASDRVVWPLAAFFWGRVWTFAGWCELRRAFRSFRLDRIGDLTVTDLTFPDEEGKRLRDYMAAVDPLAHAMLDDP